MWQHSGTVYGIGAIPFLGGLWLRFVEGPHERLAEPSRFFARHLADDSVGDANLDTKAVAGDDVEVGVGDANDESLEAQPSEVVGHASGSVVLEGKPRADARECAGP